MASILTLRIHLQDIEPQIWRRLSIPADVTLAGLHIAIQAVMGWEDAHIHMFTIDGTRYGNPEDAAGGREILEEGNVRLAQILSDGMHFLYTYDFGDDWRHEIFVESIDAGGDGPQAPTCLAGDNACPPEDSGGPYGYPELVEAVRSPKTADPEYLDWIGEFDPEHFDRELANKRLRALIKTSATRH